MHGSMGRRSFRMLLTLLRQEGGEYYAHGDQIDECACRSSFSVWCIDYAGTLGGSLSDSVKQNAGACDSGYREACVRLLKSGCTPGTNWPACQIAVDAKSKTSASLQAKCGSGDDGACYTIGKVVCGTGDASACSVLETIDPVTLENECKRGDQLACANPPPGVYAAAAMTVGDR